MTSFDPKNPRDIDYLFDWNKFKPELVGDLPPKYHKEVIENFDLQKFFLIKVFIWEKCQPVTTK